jgi:hypothetical protein
MFPQYSDGLDQAILYVGSKQLIVYCLASTVIDQFLVEGGDPARYPDLLGKQYATSSELPLYRGQIRHVYVLGWRTSKT